MNKIKKFARKLAKACKAFLREMGVLPKAKRSRRPVKLLKDRPMPLYKDIRTSMASFIGDLAKEMPLTA